MSAGIEQRVKVNAAYMPAFRDQSRYLLLYGGGGSGKSFFAAQKILFRAASNPRHRFLVVRKVARTLRQSTFQLFRDLIGMHGLYSQSTVNLSDMTITVPGGGQILHAGLDDVEKLKSIAGITGIWIEEATELVETDFMQLDIRLRGETPEYKQILLTFNPVNELHWLKRVFVDEAKANSSIYVTTYRDNAFLDPEYRQMLDDINDPVMRAVYRDGQWGRFLKGLIYTDWRSASDDEYEAATKGNDDECYAIDFGYNNPSVVLHLHMKDEAPRASIFVRELLYQSRLTNSDLIERLKVLIPEEKRHVPIYCDAAEPQRIEELVRAGFNACPADKSVNDGIDSVKRYTLRPSADSTNWMKEVRSYKWAEDKAGNLLDKPVKFMDHAMDATRYGVHTHWGLNRVSWLLN